MITKALEENGATVFIIGRRKEKLEEAAKTEAVCYSPFPVPNPSHGLSS
jgi:NADP-dependent 3-hydroxy acid dehydrogenase YdfG